MIYISEIKPVKISGLTSFAISFAFNQAIIDVLKRLPTYYYHKPSAKNNNQAFWEIPIDCLSPALESLTFIDDIQLCLLADEEVKSKQIDFNLT